MDPVQEKEADLMQVKSEPAQLGEVHYRAGVTQDAVFGALGEDGPNYRNLGWIGTAVFMLKTQIGLGVLSIPFVFQVLGMIPGVICLIVIAVIMTWSNYVIGTFKVNHPEVYGIDDAMGLVFGRWGRYIFSVVYPLFIIFCAASAMLTISIGLNAISTHGACTSVFVAVACIATILLSSIQTMGRLTYLAWVGVICIIVAVLIVTIAVGIEGRPHGAPEGPWKSDYKLFNTPSFVDATSAISSIVFSYAGTPFFFPIISEMRNPHHYTRSLMICQGIITVAYAVIAIVVYYYCGSYVASPAPGSAGKTIKQVAYGISLPGLLMTATIGIHVVGKYFFVRLLRGTQHLASNTFVHWVTWFGCIIGCALIAYIIASSIPIFSTLISLIGALLGTLVSVQPMGFMWLYDNWTEGKTQRSRQWTFLVFWSVFIIIAGTFVMISGTYGSVLAIIDSYNADGGTRPWSCKDNSNSV